MEYTIIGLLAAGIMLLYRAEPVPQSPLASACLPNVWSGRRDGRGGRVLGVAAITGSAGILVLMAGLREGSGTDYWPRYVPIFNQVAHAWPIDTDPGFLALNQIVAAVTSDHQYLFLASALLTISLVYRVVARLSVFPALSIYIYFFGGFYLESFNLMRQWLAIAILMNTIEFLMKGRFARFMVLTLLAATFHPSALVWIAAWPMARLRLNWALRTAVTSGGVIAIALLPELVRTLTVGLAPGYAWYFDSNYGERLTFDPYGLIIAGAALCLSLVPKFNRGDKYVNVTLNLQGIQIVVLAAAFFLQYAFSRVTYYFAPIQILVVPMVLSSISNPVWRRLAMTVVLAAYALSFYLKFIVWNSHGVMPYHSVLEGVAP